MLFVDGTGIRYQISGEKEAAAARQLEEALTAVSKRRSAYVQNELDLIVENIVKDYGVEIKTVL